MQLDGLMRGLATFNSELGQYTDQAIQQKRNAYADLMRAEQERRAGLWNPQRETISEALAADIPSGLPAAYGSAFRQGLGSLLVDRAAVGAKTELAAAYEGARKDPSFNVEPFIQSSRDRYLGTLSDPELVGRMSKHLLEVEGAIRSQAEKDRLTKLDTETNSGLFSSFQENLRADMSPEQLADQYRAYVPEWEKLGKSKKELAGFLLQRVQFLSDQMGGNPALFDVFDSPDPHTKQSILAMNPDLQGHVQSAREQAKSRNQKMLLEAAQSANVPRRVALDRQLETDPASITMEVVQREMGPLGIFQTTNEAAAYLARARKATADRLGDAEVMRGYEGGYLGRFKPEDQKKALEARLGPAIDAAWKAGIQGDEGAMLGLATLLMSEQNRARATVTVDALERLVSVTLGAVQDPGAPPPPAFTALAALYKGLSGDPQFRGRYFKDDAGQVMETYINAIGGKADPQIAYRTAFASVSPEAKAAGEKLKASPEFAKKLKAISEEVSGVSFWDRWLPFWGTTPQNSLHVQMAASQATREFMARTPTASEKQAMEYAQSWVRGNFAFDKGTVTAVRVPAGMADETTSEALTAYSEKVSDQYRLKDRNDGQWSVQFMSSGDGNLSVALARDGIPSHMLGSVPLETLRSAYVADKTLTPQDVEVLRQLQEQTRLDKLDMRFIEANSGTLAKAEKLDGFPKETLRAIEKARLENARSLVESVPKLSLGMPSLENLSSVPTRGAKVDNKLTAQTALHVLSQAGHMGYAASLITMGEAVMLRAYPDPAKDAGENIGMGYNLKANSKTAAADLAKAGVSRDRIEDVLAGRAQITPEQAQRLLFATLPRYEKQAREAADATAPGLWLRMTPQQRAVMIDVGWQTGNPEQFRKAWQALSSGDAAAFAEHTRVHYRSRSGQLVEDKRRGELRAAMLSGHEPWVAAVQRFGKFPANALDALALNRPRERDAQP